MYTDQVWNNEHSDHELMPGALCMICALMGGGDGLLLCSFPFSGKLLFVSVAMCFESY